MTSEKWIGGVTQEVECLLSKFEGLEFKSQSHQEEDEEILTC
jgi:hypothetical protein